jgi:hypothetical protein
MNPLEALSIGVSVLGWSLLHFVWQAAIVAALYALLRALLPRGGQGRRAERRGQAAQIGSCEAFLSVRSCTAATRVA